MKWLFILFLFGCTTTKYIDREKVIVDSTVIEQNESLQRTVHETIERHEKEKEQWEKTGITFYHHTISLPAKIVFDNGNLKSVEGNVRALNQNLYAKSSELSEARNTNDSLRVALANKETKLLKETVTITKKIKTKTFPWWVTAILLLGLLIGSFLEYIFKYCKWIFSLLKI